MSFPTKPGDTFTARAIGTYPELPDPALDPPAPHPDADPHFWAEHDFDTAPPAHVMRFGGPLGVVVVHYLDGVFTHHRDSLDGPVLRRARWDAATGTYREDPR